MSPQSVVAEAEEVRVFPSVLAQLLLVTRLVQAHETAPLQHFLNFLPLPHGHSSFGPTFGVSLRIGFFGNAGLP